MSDGNELRLVRLEVTENLISPKNQTCKLPGEEIWSKNGVREKEEPMGILLAIERVMDCFDRPIVSKQPLRLSPERNDSETVDSSEADFEWEPETEEDSVGWLFPCCSDVTAEQDLNDFLDESTLDDLSCQCRLYSKESLLTNDGSETLSSIDKLFGLELEEVTMKDGIAVNQTATTEGESTSLDIANFSD